MKDIYEILNLIPICIAIYKAVDNGKDFIFTFFNKTAEKIENIKAKDLIGKRVTEVFPGVKSFGLFDIFKEVYKTGIPKHHPITLYIDDKHAGFRENYVFKLKSGEIIAIYEDKKKEVEFNIKLENEKKKSSEAIKKYEKIIAHFTHELRSPLFSMSILLERLFNSINDEKIKETISQLKSITEIFINHINVFLDFHTNKLSKLELNKTTFFLEDVIEDIINIISPLTYEKGLEIFINIKDIKECTFKGDIQKIRQILINIMVNAVKYTESGYIKLNISRYKKGLIFEIIDTGIGIPDEKKVEIFNDFITLSNNKNYYPNTGLGLSITQQLINLMNGSIKILDNKPRGTIFKLKIPIDISKSNTKKCTVENYKLSTAIFSKNKELLNSIKSFFDETSTKFKCYVKFRKDILKNYEIIIIDYDMINDTIIKTLNNLKNKKIFILTPPYYNLNDNFYINPNIIAINKPFSLTKLTNYLIKKEKKTEKNKKHLKKIDILIIDDSTAVLIALKNKLSNLNLNIYCFHTFKKAFDFYTTKNPQIIISDFYIKNKTAKKFIKKIRNFEYKNRLKNTPIIIFSGEEKEIIYKKIEIKTHNIYFFKKERNLDMLLDKLKEIIEELEFEKEINNSIDKLIPGYLNRIKDNLKHIKKSFKNNDFNTIKKFAHKLKGSGVLYKQYKLSKYGEFLEEYTVKNDLKNIERYINKIEEYLKKNS